MDRPPPRKEKGMVAGRSLRWFCMLVLFYALTGGSIREVKGEDLLQETGKDAPSGGTSTGARSRLTLKGEWTTDSYLQKNFFLGAGGQTTTGYASDFDAYWTQNLRLYPRFIIADNLNLNLNVAFAHGIWGLDNETPTPNRPGYTNLWNHKDTFFHLQLDWAYLAYRNAWSQTRWYLGRQKFGLGNLIVLDENATGLQVYKDFSRWNSSLGLGFAKEWEGTNGLTDRNLTTGTPSGPDGRDADLLYVEWHSHAENRNLSFNPFFASYLDRGNADGRTFLPDELTYEDARFRPNISRATVLGVAAELKSGAFRVQIEADQLSGKDRVPNTNSGPDARLDVNNGDLKGSNLYARLTVGGGKVELGGVLGIGSGDPDPRSGEGNFNKLRTNGHFYLTEIWEDSITPDEEGLVPGGLGSTFSRGYRELENTRIYQGNLALQLWSSFRLFSSFSVIRASEALRPWSDSDGNGIIDPAEFGSALSTELGSEIDGRIDWKLDPGLLLTLRGGIFFPRFAAGYLINGTSQFQEKAYEVRATITVPIAEFSLGG